MFLNSGLKIFDVLEILFKNPQTRKEIAIILRKRGICTDFTTVTKYLRTLRKLCFEIEYKDKKLHITKTPFKIIADDDEAIGFFIFLFLLNKICGKVKKTSGFIVENKVKSFITNKNKQKIKLPFEFDFSPSKESDENIEKIMQYKKEEIEHFKIKYNENYSTLLYQGLKFRKNGIFLTGIDTKTGKNRAFKLNKIKKIKPIIKKSEPLPRPFYDTVFKLSGRLVKSYTLRKGERAKYANEEITVINRYEEKDELFSRLLKYGSYCKIVYPESDVKKFSKKLENLIKHYCAMS